jgi:hypothetical protein
MNISTTKTENNPENKLLSFDDIKCSPGIYEIKEYNQFIPDNFLAVLSDLANNNYLILYIDGHRNLLQKAVETWRDSRYKYIKYNMSLSINLSNDNNQNVS